MHRVGKETSSCCSGGDEARLRINEFELSPWSPPPPFNISVTPGAVICGGRGSRARLHCFRWSSHLLPLALQQYLGRQPNREQRATLAVHGPEWVLREGLGMLLLGPAEAQRKRGSQSFKTLPSSAPSLLSQKPKQTS